MSTETTTTTTTTEITRDEMNDSDPATDTDMSTADADATTATATPSELERVVDGHLAAYCDADPATRREQFELVWSADGALFDPPFEGRGIDALCALTDVVLQHFPGHRFERTSVVDSHHGFARYGWRLVDRNGVVSVTGTDVVEFDDTGRLVSAVGFFGDLAAI